MNASPGVWRHGTLEECCERNFKRAMAECVGGDGASEAARPAADGEESPSPAGTEREGSDAAAVPPQQADEVVVVPAEEAVAREGEGPPDLEALENEGKATPPAVVAVERKMKVAWGDERPPPPGL